MEQIRAYLIRVTAAAAICGLTVSFFGKKGAIGAAVKFLTGVFLVVTAAAPWTGLNFETIRIPTEDLEAQASEAVMQGAEQAHRQMVQIIKDRSEAYILDKAASISVCLEPEVTLTDTDPPVPWSVTLKGSAAPYDRKRLEQWICQDLGVQKERIRWK